MNVKKSLSSWVSLDIVWSGLYTNGELVQETLSVVTVDVSFACSHTENHTEQQSCEKALSSRKSKQLASYSDLERGVSPGIPTD
ncbi:hypothetical protein KDI_02340 [Dictyobacter arantiisoli]|uniref:Uncharacterized protein n=1 Tax=Dictyobacter arantiisoli TaxID=2014874 RepID=A0A5A5T5H2_9CHLR|nr:hypothetical protein KDI_02340 [Dictyobacter arantiisoli]